MVNDSSNPNTTINKKKMTNSIPTMYRLVRKVERGNMIFGMFKETIIDFLFTKLFIAWVVPLENRCTIIKPLNR